MRVMLQNLNLAARLLKRDWRSGELGLLLVALVIAVASIASVGFFVDRMRQALSQQATQLLGADLVLASDAPLEADMPARARTLGLQMAEVVVFPSMALAGERHVLASVKAVSPDYPLRGQLQLRQTQGQGMRPARAGPGPGQAWVDPQVLSALGLPMGGSLQLGESRFEVTALIALEPDRGTNFVNFAPRILIAVQDLEATGLIQPASRVSYRRLFAGEPERIANFKTWLETRIKSSRGKGLRIESLEAGRPELRATLERAEQFLGLVGFLSALIAAVAVGLAARRFVARHLDACAVMKAIGMTQPRLVSLLLLELLLLALVGAVIGAALGWAVHFALVAGIRGVMQIALPAPSMMPALQAGLAGTVLLLGFAAWPFITLAGVPPLRVLRRDLSGAPSPVWGGIAAALSFGLLLFLFAANRKLALMVLAGFAAGALLFALAGMIALWALAGLRRLLSRQAARKAGGMAGRWMVLRLALASLTRRRAAVITQTVALSVGLMALLVLTITRTDLIEGWRRASPPDAPDRFVINIQPDQVAGVREALVGAGIAQPELSPMIRGRLIEVNGQPIRSERLDNERAQRLVEREFNLSTMTEAPLHNRLLEGRWYAPQAREISAEQGIMKTLGLRMGDELAFDVAGERITARISSVRKVSWDSMRVNFFMILSPALVTNAPRTYITAYREPASSSPAASLDQRLVKAWPNLTVFDTGNIVRQVQTMLEQVVGAVQVLFLLTLLAGLVVLYGALASSRDEREQEAGLMRALGASRAVLARAQLWEMFLAGALAGVLAACAALALGAVLAEFIFEFSLPTRWPVLGLGALAGGILSLVAGWIGLRRVFESSPMQTLRRVQG